MQFDKSQTYRNLARSFAGECQAGMRYQFMAKTAMQEGYTRLSDCIKSIAKNETVHARIFYDAMIRDGKNAKNVTIEAGYPFRSGTLAEMLAFSAEDESAEVALYPEFARIAKEEGYDKIAEEFDKIAQIEGNHQIIFEYLANAVKSGTLYESDSPKLWICSECGYMHTSSSAWESCPVCKSEKGYVELHLPFDYLGRNGMSRFAEEKGE